MGRLPPRIGIVALQDEGGRRRFVMRDRDGLLERRLALLPLFFCAVDLLNGGQGHGFRPGVAPEHTPDEGTKHR